MGPSNEGNPKYNTSYLSTNFLDIITRMRRFFLVFHIVQILAMIKTILTISVLRNPAVSRCGMAWCTTVIALIVFIWNMSFFCLLLHFIKTHKCCSDICFVLHDSVTSSGIVYAKMSKMWYWSKNSDFDFRCLIKVTCNVVVVSNVAIYFWDCVFRDGSQYSILN